MVKHTATVRSHKVRRSLVGLAASALVCGGLLATGEAAPAATTPHALSHAAQVRAYWTRDRMLHAISLDPSGTSAAGVGTQRTTDRATAGAAVQASPAVPAPRSIGKLFFSDHSTDYVCSASAIATQSRNQVLTAGHCVHTGPHPEDGLLPGLLGGLLGSRPRYFSNWMYVPRYADGRAPYGKWVATNRFVSSGWIDNENFSQDQGILTVGRLNGHRLVDVTGGNRIAIGRSANEQGVRIWGWPAESPYDGETAWRCDGATVRDDSDSPGDARMACTMTAGSSGGPWFLPGNRTANVGTIFAVTSRGSVTGPRILLAHPFTRALRTLITRAGG